VGQLTNSDQKKACRLTDATHDTAGASHDEWRSRVSGLISYRYLGTYSETRGRHAAQGWLTARRDLRGPVGLLAAPLGIALLDTAGINVDPLAVVAPTRIDVQVLEPAVGVEQVRVDGRVLREGRSQFFTEGRFVDAADPSRLIGLGSTHWAVSGPNPGFQYVDSRAGAPRSDDLPPLYEAFGARVREDGNLEIPELTAELGGTGLHQGPIQVVPEAAAMRAAGAALGHDQFWIEHLGTTIMSRGIGVPFVTRADLLHTDDRAVVIRVELRDEGNEGRLCSVTTCRFRIT
jgi:acyl-coenzyme A thioesterase PaaI-like protein